MQGRLRLPPATYALVDGGARVLALLALLHAGAAALGMGYDPRWLAAKSGPIGWGVLMVTGVLYALAMLVVRSRVRGGIVAARAAAIVLASLCLVDALASLRAGHAGSGTPVPLTLLLAAWLYTWVLARRARPMLRDGGSQDRLWHKMLERAHP